MKIIILAASFAAISISVCADSDGHNHSANSHGEIPSHAASGDFDQTAVHGDLARIDGLLRTTFETETGTLSLNPILIAGDHAMVGWVQDGRGGRAILSKDSHGVWTINLCGGAMIKGREAFEALGLPATDATHMAAEQEIEEAKLDQRTIALMDSFGSTVFVD
mgnify:CR=1 FL=1